MRIGDRVRLNAEGIKLGRIMRSTYPRDREGSILGFGRKPHEHTARILWDGRKSPDYWHIEFLELAAVKAGAA